jgi:hypothetical protein
MKPVQAATGDCRIIRVVDGDTVTLMCAEDGMQSARLLGFDTPEKFSPQCTAEFLAAERAGWALRTLHPEGRPDGADARGGGPVWPGAGAAGAGRAGCGQPDDPGRACAALWWRPERELVLMRLGRETELSVEVELGDLTVTMLLDGETAMPVTHLRGPDGAALDDLAGADLVDGQAAAAGAGVSGAGAGGGLADRRGRGQMPGMPRLGG